MFNPWNLLVLYLSGCIAQSVPEDYAAALSEMRQLVGQHAADAASASSLDDIEVLELDYQEDFRALVLRMRDGVDTIERCGMHRDEGSMMSDADDANARMDDMEGRMSAHMVDHDDHADVAECHTEESAHRAAMEEMLDALDVSSEDWPRRRMNCPG